MLLQSAKFIEAGFATIRLAGVGIETIFGALILIITRNPSLKDEILKIVILGFVLTDATAFFASIVVFYYCLLYKINRKLQINVK